MGAPAGPAGTAGADRLQKDGPKDAKAAPPEVAKVALVGFAAPVAGLVEPALAGDGYAVSRVPLDADTVRTLVRGKPRVIVLDSHPYVDTRALLADLRATAELAEVTVVAVGVTEAPEVPGLEVVRQPGRSLELDRLMQAVNRASGRYAG
ncbi:MAG TPA: hypothetical protein VFX49_04130 [Chloroflexota bacterium]|nr:hypothetical protein [Chloroflexota bacterium]